MRSVGNAPPPTAHCRWGLDAYFLSKTQTAGTRLSACTCNCMAQPVRWPWSHQFIRDIRYGIVNKSVLYCWNGRTKHNLQRIRYVLITATPPFNIFAFSPVLVENVVTQQKTPSLLDDFVS